MCVRKRDPACFFTLNCISLKSSPWSIIVNIFIGCLKERDNLPSGSWNWLTRMLDFVVRGIRRKMHDLPSYKNELFMSQTSTSMKVHTQKRCIVNPPLSRVHLQKATHQHHATAKKCHNTTQYLILRRKHRRPPSTHTPQSIPRHNPWIIHMQPFVPRYDHYKRFVGYSHVFCGAGNPG